MRPLLLLMAISALALAPRAGADSIVIDPLQDATLYENDYGALSNGGGEFLFSGRTDVRGPGAQRALLAFELSGIPAGATIDAARLTLTRSKGLSTGPFALHALAADWGEGDVVASRGQGSGGPAQPGDATWIHRFSPDTLWTSPGGDFASTPSASASIASGELVFSGPGLAEDVQRWLADPAQNAGWIVISSLEAQSRSAVRFYSRTGTAPPSLAIDYSVPEPAAALLLVLVAATRRARRA